MYHTILLIDKDRNVCAIVEKIDNEYVQSHGLASANCGDHNNNTTSERPICKKRGTNQLYGLGDKI